MVLLSTSRQILVYYFNYCQRSKKKRRSKESSFKEANSFKRSGWEIEMLVPSYFSSPGIASIISFRWVIQVMYRVSQLRHYCLCINSRPINTAAHTLSVCFSKWKQLNCTSSIWIDCLISQETVGFKPKRFSLLMQQEKEKLFTQLNRSLTRTMRLLKAIFPTSLFCCTKFLISLIHLYFDSL